VHFLQRHRSYYGGFGHVRATLKGMTEVFRRFPSFEYAVLLTGQDYPIKSNSYIEEYFARNHPRSFMEYFPLPSEEWDEGGLDRIERWHIRLGGRYVCFPNNQDARIKRTFPRGLQPFGGSAYWCLSRKCMEFIHHFLEVNPRYTRFFRFVNVPDEIFFQTIVMNSPLADQVVNDDLRYVEWRDPEIAGGPAILGKDDFGKMIESRKLFARKFDIGHDPEILDLIDARIGA
jgi:hypothetical protein